MDKLGRRQRRKARKLLIHMLLFALVVTALDFFYNLHGNLPCFIGKEGQSSSGLSVNVHHVFSDVLQATFSAGRSMIYHFGKTEKQKALDPEVVWSSKEWRQKIDALSHCLARLMSVNLLKAQDKVLCITKGTRHEVLALKEVGVVDVQRMDLNLSHSIFLQTDMHKMAFQYSFFDFIFCNLVDSALPPDIVVSEIERTLRIGGIAVLYLATHTNTEKLALISNTLDSFLELFKDFELVHVQSIDFLGLDTEIVLRKSKGNGAWPSSSGCYRSLQERKIMERAEPLVMEEPPKPWLTLKENAKKIMYLSSMYDISRHPLHFYIDVGARSYRSSVGSWFMKRYPKQRQDFLVYAIEADDSFAGEYSKLRNVKFLPYAAWIRNESLLFGANPENKVAEGEIGMGRIQGQYPLQKKECDNNQQFKIVQGFDFAEWLRRTVTKDDFVVMKMDVEGAEFDILPRMLETGAICLVDELFLECHYNRWQRTSPLRSTKYGTTYGECLSLLQLLRNKSVLVHQWW